MAEGLSLDGILSEEQIEGLFTDENGTGSEDTEPNNEQDKETTEIDAENIFAQSESVGSEEQNNEGKESTSEEDGTSPKNFYSSIATALKDSTFPDLDVTDVNDADKFSDAFEKLLQSRLDERQKRIDEALSSGMEPTVVRQFESTLNQLHSISVDSLRDENNENTRKQLIYIDLINKGYSKEDAIEEVNDSVQNGTDIKRAERALKSNITYFSNKYNEELNKAKEQEANEIKERKEQVEALKKDMLSNNKAFGDIEISQVDRQKAYDAISKPIYKDPQSGEMFTAIQKYESEHRAEFLKNLGILFVLTDNFTNLDGLISGKVKKESKKAIRELENTLNNTHRTSDGNLNFVSGVSEDPESIFKGFTLDV